MPKLLKAEATDVESALAEVRKQVGLAIGLMVDTVVKALGESETADPDKVEEASAALETLGKQAKAATDAMRADDAARQFKFNEDQPRDEDGKFSSGGGGGGGGSSGGSVSDKIHGVVSKVVVGAALAAAGTLAAELTIGAAAVPAAAAVTVGVGLIASGAVDAASHTLEALNVHPDVHSIVMSVVQETVDIFKSGNTERSALAGNPEAIMSKTIDISEFRGAVQRIGQLGLATPAVRFAATGDAVATSDARTLTFVFSDESVDRYGDVIYARGWDLANFNANPIALFGHDAGTVENVIGRAKNVRVEGSRLIGDIEFMGAEVNPNAEAVYQMVKGGFLKTVSVGFQPIEWELAKDKSRPQGVNFKKQELLEISIVPIPANPKALVQAKAAGIAIERLGLTLPSPLAGEGGAQSATDEGAINYRALAKSYRKKGLNELSILCDLVSYAEHVCQRVEREAADEGDGSPIPARMRAWVDEGNKIIAAMAQEETAENIAGKQDPADIEGEVARGVQKALAALGLTKSGKTISAANEKKLRDAHAHITAAAECVASVVDPDDEDGAPDERDDDDDESASIAAAELRARKARALAHKHKA